MPGPERSLPVVRIADRLVGGDQPAFIIAEAGCNHENDVARAREMVLAAAAAGADAIKFQSFSPDTLVTRDAPKFWDLPGPGATQHEEFAQIQPRFTRAQDAALAALAHQRGLSWFSTPCDERWADYLDELGAPAFKIASMDLTHLPLLRHVARKRKPVIVSTGASEVPEIREAVACLDAGGAAGIVLLHCVSAYPTAPADVNLRMMQDLARHFPRCVIGYSDHTVPGRTAVPIPVLAVAAGAKVIEKHFTFDASRSGYDHEISADYAGMARLVAACREAEQALGSRRKAPVAAEARARQFGRRSIVAATPIPRGSAIGPDMVAVKRPGTGIAPRELERVLGRVARRDIREDEVLTWELLA